MILPKVDGDRFVAVVSREALIAFQKFEYGYAVAAPGEAYYAPVTHPSGGNLDNSRNSLGGAFVERLGYAFLHRAGMPALRTLRPTAKPTPTNMLTAALASYGGPDPMANFDKFPGDNPIIVDFATQVVIQAIEEHGRSDLQATMGTLKRDMTAEAIDLVIEHAEAARELCDREDPQLMLIRLHMMQSVQAMKSVLEMMLRP